MTARGSALLAALLLMALAGIVASGLAELGRRALARARLDRDGVRAWYLAEAGLADVTAGLPPGHAFTDALATTPASPPASGAAWTWGEGLADDADETPPDDTRDGNARVILRVNAFGPPPVRRRLEALIGRERAPLQPGALSLTGDLGSLTPDFSLDGRDFDMASGCTAPGPGPARPGLALPEGAGLPLLAHPERIVGRGAAPSITRREAPSFAEVEGDARATRLAAGALPAALGDPAAPRFTVVDGDAVADQPTAGVGALYVAGRLRIASRLAFTGVLAAAGGIDVAPGATLEVCGGAWAAGAPALAVDGAGFVRASDAALRLAATLAPLPARARIVAVREAP
ncbi:MAG: hypothetical protein IT293_15820 [Deltaproteobacteria bacterium]|nr:hypothetical protein [Deltaproteobacteria bacterium]